MPESNSDRYDLAVIGGGTSGIAAARFYLDVHPNAQVVILERDSAVGGVWSSERVYPGFRSQGGARMGGYSDVAFLPDKDKVDDYGFYYAKEMAKYLDAYVDDKVYSGKSLRERIHFNTKVVSLEKNQRNWVLNLSNANAESVGMTTDKIIVASGSTSVANMPDFKNRDEFGGPIVHTLDYGGSRLFENEDIKKIAVIGGGKSAGDMVYESVKAGREVKWIIRKSGKGPGAFVSGKMRATGIHNAVELAMTRAFISIMFLPGLAAAGYWQKFLFKTRLGAWVMRKLNASVRGKLAETAGYDGRPLARESFKNLKTEMDGLTMNVPGGGVHHDDFWDVVAQNVDVYREDIERVEHGRIVFKSGESTEADAILCGTGFEHSFPFLTTEQCVEFGLPHPRAAESAQTSREWAELEVEAEKVVRERFYTILPSPPSPASDKFGDISPSHAPFRLYNCMAPTNGDRTIVFTGFAALTNMFANSEISAIWATAYLDGKLKLPSTQETKKDIAYTTTYMRIRNPTYGRVGNFYGFDYFPFIDRLLEEVGLTSHRKSWWREQFTPLLTKDFAGLKDEYLERYGGGKAEPGQI